MKKDESKPVDEDKPQDNLIFARLQLSISGVSVCGSRFLYDWMLWEEELRRIICPNPVS
jgi:hypothetical protein